MQVFANIQSDSGVYRGIRDGNLFQRLFLYHIGLRIIGTLGICDDLKGPCGSALVPNRDGG
jgi:hypothetical protein